MKIQNAIEIADRLASWQMLEDACDVLERCLERHPAHPLLLQRLGRLRLDQGRPEEARPLLEQALAHHRLRAATVSDQSR